MRTPSDSRADRIRHLLARPGAGVHLVGICGVGMAGLAVLLKQRGCRVTGCDAQRGRLAGWLEAQGIPVDQGHDPSHLSADGVEAVVRTPAVPPGNSELRRAEEGGIPVFDRGEVLPRLLDDRVSVAVCGTHGKTTTSTLVACLLRDADRNPSWCIGGESAALGGVAGGDGRGPIVVEADESDGTLAGYRVDVAVVTNIEFDHMEHFADVDAFEDCFRACIEHARRRVVFCAEDERAARLCRGHARAVSFGLDVPADVRGRRLELRSDGLTFELEIRGQPVGRFDLPLPGRHNALNTLAAMAACLEFDITPEAMRQALSRVTLPMRRFERVASGSGVEVISDYAHHPSEVRALVRAAVGLGRRRILAVFQPHRYTRTRALGADFPAAFDGIAELVLAPVYAASEDPVKGGLSADLYRHFRSQAGARGGGVPRLAVSLEAAWGFLRREAAAGDLVLIIGAGDVERVAGWAKREGGVGVRADADVAAAGLSEASRWRRDEPLGVRTTLGVGGTADLWVEVATVDDLSRLLRWSADCAWKVRVLGAGSNVLVSDLGLRGVTLRLGGDAFVAIREGADGGVSVGAAVPIARFLDWLQARGHSGYEFLEGIPGTVGGAVRMNAGAFGESIGSRVLGVEVVGMDGVEQWLHGRELTFGYREVGGIGEGVITRVRLQNGAPETPEAVAGRRRETAARRGSWRGMRTAGSIFRNPPGDFAGRLIEAAGLKGLRMGGAEISVRHANVIVAGDGALASDVLALIETARFEVKSRFGVALETEVRILE